MFRSISTLLALVVMAALLASGCGGSGDPPSKTEFRKQAYAICHELFENRSSESAAYARKHGGISSKELVSGIVLPSIQRAAEELGALTPPKGDEKEVGAIVAAMETGVEKAEKLVKKDPESFEEPFTDVFNRARAYGLYTCADIL